MEQARQKSKRWVISTREEMREAAIEVAREASRKVSIFTHDLEPGIYDDPEFLEIIKRLVLSQTYARIRVLIADPARAVKSGNNFVHLGRIPARSRGPADSRRSVLHCRRNRPRLPLAGSSLGRHCRHLRTGSRKTVRQDV